MLSLTRKSDYALVAMTGLTELSPAPTSARELSDQLRLPLPALRNILKSLARAELLESTQGSTGGYRLAKPADQITLASIVEAIEGPIRLAPCCSTNSDPGSDACRREDSCRIKAAVQSLNHRLEDFLLMVTLGDLTRDALEHEQSRATIHVPSHTLRQGVNS